jgi:RHS repeat-associated protein
VGRLARRRASGTAGAQTEGACRFLEVAAGTQTWYYPNLEGGTAAEANSMGSAVGGITLYDPFGNALTSLQSDSPDGLAYGFEGKHGIGTDTDAGGIVLMGARLYNSNTGRFLQVDPIFGGSANAYDYVSQDPLNASDLSGTMDPTSTVGCPPGYGEAPNGACHRPVWKLVAVVIESDDSDFYVPGAKPLELVITDLTGLPGGYVVSTDGQTQHFTSAGVFHRTSNPLLFWPRFGQPGYDVDIQYNPLASTSEGDTADSVYYVKAYECEDYCDGIQGS